jgi:hypothetical protein
MTTHENEPGHGHSVAAWSAVIVAIIGVTLATLGVCITDNTITAIGSVITVVSIFLGPVLAKLGFGIAGKSTSSK